MEQLAKRIAQDEKIVLGSIKWDKFPDGFPNIFIENVESVRKADVAFLASFTPETIFEQLAVIYALPKYGAKSLQIILPFFPVGTMDRVTRMGEVTTAKSLARQLSFVKGCYVELIMYDIHSMHEWHYFEGDLNPRLECAMPLLYDLLGNFDQDGKAYIACFPDEGAWKRFGKMFEFRWDTILCHKDKMGKYRKIKIVEGNPNGRNVIIIDDLAMTGGTILECAKLLESKGAKSVSAYVTHAVFPNHSYHSMSKFPFANFWVTDSCPETIEAMSRVGPITNFNVLSLAPAIAKILTSSK